MSELFSPGAKTVSISVNSSSQAVQVTSSRGKAQVRVHNDGSATVWIAFGDSTVTASLSTAIPLGSGQVEGFTVPDGGPIYAAAIAAGSTGSVYFTPGSGI